MTRATGSRWSERLGPFAHRGFTVYWVGGFISNVGTWLQTVAASVFVYQLTGSAFAVGVLNFASFLPIFLFSLVGGVVGDRYDRRLVVLVTHTASTVLAAALAVVSFTGGASELQVIVIAFALNTSWAIAKPAYVSIVPAVVPRAQITEAVGLNTLQFVIGQMVGPVLAAIMIETVGISWAFALNAVTYLGPMAAMAYLWRRGLGGGTAAANRRPGDVRIGVVPYVRSHTWVLFLLLGVIAISAPVEIVRTLSPALAEMLSGSASAAGLLVAAQSIGSAIALVAFVPIQRAGRARDLAGIGLGVQAAGIVATFLARDLTVALAGGALIGFGFSLCFPVLTSTLQAEVPDGVRGRVMALHQMSHLGNRPFAALTAGLAAVAIGVQPAVLLGLVLAPIGFAAAQRAWRGVDADRARGDGRPPGDPTAAARRPIQPAPSSARDCLHFAHDCVQSGRIARGSAWSRPVHRARVLIVSIDVAVDADLCIGSGECVRILPAAFRIDEDQNVSVPLAGAGDQDPERLKLAAFTCPTQSIRLVAGDGTVIHESN